MRTRLQPSSSYFVRAGTLALILASAAARPGIAQQRCGERCSALPPVQVEGSVVSEQKMLADRLDAEAAALRGSPKRYFEAGQLHRRAALLRGIDSAAVSSFRSAAWMFSAAGENGHARGMMERAAERAADVGDVERAANCLIDAALLAAAGGREDKVPALLARMHALLTSPLLADDRRAEILQRVGASATLASIEPTAEPRR